MGRYQLGSRGWWSTSSTAKKTLALTVLLCTISGISITYFLTGVPDEDVPSISVLPKFDLLGKSDNLNHILNDTLGVSRFPTSFVAESDADSRYLVPEGLCYKPT